MSKIIEQMKDLIPAGKVYDDALSPSMKEIGEALKNVTKTARFVLAPFDYLAAHHSRFLAYLKRLEEKVNDKNLVEGHASVIVPTVEGLLLAEENSLLSELFLKLLENSIDVTKQSGAHPSFPSILKSLSHDEAVMLYYLKKGRHEIINPYVTESEYNKMTKFNSFFPSQKLVFQDLVFAYAHHLASLGLITWQPNIMNVNQFGEHFLNSCVPDEFEGLD